jgi:hypothetical protein
MMKRTSPVTSAPRCPAATAEALYLGPSLIPFAWRRHAVLAVYACAVRTSEMALWLRIGPLQALPGASSPRPT